MTDKNRRDSPTPKNDHLDHTNQDDALPPNSASSTDNVVDKLGEATVSVSEVVDIYDGEGIDPEYQAKSHAISCAIQQIGMGRYQVRGPEVFECIPLK